MIIGVLGFISSGKGTVGDLLKEKGFVQLSFASTLKDAVAVIFGFDRALLEGDTKESREWREIPDPFWSDKFGYDITPRQILQKFGTDCARNHFLDSIWVNSVEKLMLKYINENKNVVFSDVRFENEIEFLKSQGGFLIQVDRVEARPDWFEILINDREQLKLRSDIHKSEYEWYGNPNIDHIIENNGTFDELKKTLYTLLQV